MPAGRPRVWTGFTVVELLVVVSIIGLLVGILLPSLSHARRQARVQVVATQIQRIGTACEAYHTAFGAYPGPVPDGLPRKYPSHSVVNTPVSQTENLVLGLMGCLLPEVADRTIPTDPTSLITHTAEGSIAGVFKRIPEYDSAGQWRAVGSHPRFYDAHPQELADPDGDGRVELVERAFGRRPIMYYRAVAGRSGLWLDETQSVYDYLQNGFGDHGYSADADSAPPNQARLIAMLWDRAHAADPQTFTDGDPCLRADGFILIAPGPDQRYADNNLTAPGDLLGPAEVEKDNITNFR